MRAALAWMLARFGGAVPGALALLAVLAANLFAPQALDRLSHLAFDAWQRADPRPAGNAPVQIVAIDEESLRRVGQWPWSRIDIARLIEQLGSAGAAVVALDVVFSEPDRTSATAVAADLARRGADPRAIEALRSIPDSDAVLAETVRRIPTVTGFFLTNDPAQARAVPAAGIALSGSSPRQALPAFTNAVLPLPGIERAVRGKGFLTFTPDADGIVRRVPLLARQGGEILPALSLEALRVAQQAGAIAVKTSDGGGTRSGGGEVGVVAVRTGQFTVPTTDRGEMWLHYPAPGSIEPVPAWQILSGALSAEQLERAFAGRIVFVGASAVGLRDLVATPVRDRELGVAVHAQAAAQIVSGDFLTRPDWALGLERTLMLALGLSLLVLLPLIGAVRGAILGTALALAAVAGSWLAFHELRYLLDPTWPLVAVMAVYLVETAWTYYREERRRSYIHRAFDHYLSPELVRRIAADPKQLELGGEEREVSVMFADIRDFSRLSERLAPQDVTSFLIGFMTPMCDVLIAHRATIDKFIGDGILAFWNAPLDDPEHHRHAARAALAMIARLDRLNADRGGDPLWPGAVRIGIGLNAGPCCVGNIGSAQRLSYSLVGDTVNLASRLESLTKHYGVPIVISSAFRRDIPEFAALPLDRVRVAGREAPEEVWALLGDEALANDAAFRALVEAQTAMLAAFRERRWAEAARCLTTAEDRAGPYAIRPLYALYRERIATFVASPPPEDWDGVFATDKLKPA